MFQLFAGIHQVVDPERLQRAGSGRSQSGVGYDRQQTAKNGRPPEITCEAAICNILRILSMTENADPLVPVPIPALVTILIALERDKGAPLTKEEVINTRDNCGCMMLPYSQKVAGEEARGYSDIDLENVWESWLVFRNDPETVAVLGNMANLPGNL